MIPWTRSESRRVDHRTVEPVLRGVAQPSSHRSERQNSPEMAHGELHLDRRHIDHDGLSGRAFRGRTPEYPTGAVFCESARRRLGRFRRRGRPCPRRLGSRSPLDETSFSRQVRFVSRPDRSSLRWISRREWGESSRRLLSLPLLFSAVHAASRRSGASWAGGRAMLRGSALWVPAVRPTHF